jgi:hypothetical protein
MAIIIYLLATGCTASSNEDMTLVSDVTINEVGADKALDYEITEDNELEVNTLPNDEYEKDEEVGLYHDTGNFINDPTYNPDLYILFPTVVFETQEDVDNVDMSVFVHNPEFAFEENEQLIRTILYIALYEHGFDIGRDIWEFTNIEASRELVHEWRDTLYYEHGIEPEFIPDNFLGLHPLDLSFSIVTDFMMLAVRNENNGLGVPVRIRSWPREQAYLDTGSWLELVFINTDGQYKLASMLNDA